MNQMRSVGQLLKETREAKGINTKQVSNSIRIRESLIEAIEAGNYEIFTSEMHLKSFLRSYASYLDVSEEKIMALYRREKNIPEENTDSNKKQQINNNKYSIVISKFLNIRSFISAFSLVLLVLVGIFFYKQWYAFNQPPVLEIKSPHNNDNISTDTFVIEGFTGDPSVKVVLDGNEANYVDYLGNFKINAKFTESGLKRFTLLAKTQFNKQKEVSLDLTYKPPVKAEAKPKIRINNKGKDSITLTYFLDKDTVPRAVLIKQNTPITIEYSEKLQIKNYDKINLELFLNDDANPTTSIDSKEFSIIIENGRPIINQTQIQNEKQK